MLNTFGTDGIRGNVGTGLFTQEALTRLGNAIGHWALQKYGLRPQLLITQDTRISCGFVKASLKAGLLQHPLDIFDTQLLPTPAIAHILQTNPAYHAGIIISASHNPYEDNGIKIMDAITGKLSPQDERLITQLLHAPQLHNNNKPHSLDYGSDVTLVNAQDIYCNKLVSLFEPGFLNGITVVLDTAHGATYQVAPRIFTALGATVITLHDQPNGSNINKNCGALHLEALQAGVIKHNAHIGFAFDGDGDRVMAVNKHGEVKDGDDMLTLLLTHPAYSNGTTVVGTVMTNEGFAQLLAEQGKELIRTPVGDKHIAEKLNAHKLLLGGEPSGHIILRDLIYTGDGILVALRILEAILRSQNWLLTTFTKYPQVTLNVPVSSKRDLGEYSLRSLITQAEQILAKGRILVRYSGTENVLRVMVETDSLDQAQSVCKQLAHNLAKQL